MGDMEPGPAFLCNQSWPHMEGLGHKDSHKTFGLWSVLPAECSRTTAWHNCHQRDFIHKLMWADAESHSQTLDIASGVLQRMGREEQRDKRGEGHHKKTAHRINLLRFRQAHRYQGACMDLSVCYGWIAWCSFGNPNSGNRGCIWLFFLLVGPFSSYRVVLSCLDVMVCAWPYGSLLCCVWCPWETCSFLRGGGGWTWGGDRKGKEETGKRGGREVAVTM